MTTRDERDEREHEYGIGRVPADVDPVDETMAQMVASETMARMRPQRAASEMGTCDYCGQRMPRILLMNATVGTACPSCYDDAEDGRY